MYKCTLSMFTQHHLSTSRQSAMVPSSFQQYSHPVLHKSTATNAHSFARPPRASLSRTRRARQPSISVAPVHQDKISYTYKK